MNNTIEAASRFADRLADRLITHLEEKKKKRKPLCNRGNAYHGLDGKFVDPEKEAGSFSLQKGDGKDDCSWGVSRRSSASRKRVNVKRKCGRDGKYRCKDSSAKYEEQSEESLDSIIEQVSVSGDWHELELYLSAVIKRAFDSVLTKLKKQKKVSPSCSFTDLMRYSNTVAKADKGKLK